MKKGQFKAQQICRDVFTAIKHSSRTATTPPNSSNWLSHLWAASTDGTSRVLKSQMSSSGFQVSKVPRAPSLQSRLFRT